MLPDDGEWPPKRVGVNRNCTVAYTAREHFGFTIYIYIYYIYYIISQAGINKAKMASIEFNFHPNSVCSDMVQWYEKEKKRTKTETRISAWKTEVINCYFIIFPTKHATCAKALAGIWPNFISTSKQAHLPVLHYASRSRN